MDANDILLWLGVSMLAVWVLQLVGQLRMLRAQGGPGQVGVPALLVLVLAIGALGLLSWLLLPAWSGWILVGMEAAVTLPSLFLQLAIESFEEQRLARALRWAALSAALMPLPFHRSQVRQLRAMVAILRGEERPGPAGQAGQGGPSPATQSGSPSSTQDSLQLFRWSVAGRWQEIATAIAALPQQGEPVRITLARLRSSYEIHEFESALAAYARLQGFEALPQRGVQRMVQGSRLLLLAAAGEEAAVGVISTALGYSAERREGIMAWAAWAGGDASGARARLTALAQSQDPVIRTTAQVRLAAPPPPASALPERWRELARALAADPSWAVRRRARAVQALVAVNTAVFAITCSLAIARGAAVGGGTGGADRPAGAEDDLTQALTGMGALLTPVAAGQEWRLLTSLFLHAGILHLVMNMLGLVAIGPRIERALGWLRFTVLYLVSGLGGNLVFDMADTLRGGHNVLVGASGCIMGVCGALVVESAIEFRRNREAGWPRLRMLMFLLVLQWLFDASHPEVAALAHLGGLAIGAACAWWMLPHPPAPLVAAGDGR